MIDIEETQSVNQEKQNLSSKTQYQKCPNCSRNFFIGKLKLHLKLCTFDKPMILSPKKQKRNTFSQMKQKKTIQFSSKQIQCKNCHAHLPAFLFDKHKLKCNSLTINPQQKHNKSTNLYNKQQLQLPNIKNVLPSSVRGQSKKIHFNKKYQIKLRQELSCFKKAQLIKQVQCVNCGRFFSKQASLRHIPICQYLKTKQRYLLALNSKKTIKKIKTKDIQDLHNISQTPKTSKTKKHNHSQIINKQKSIYFQNQSNIQS